MNIWVVIPAYNEASRIAKTVSDAKKYASEIVVVDDGSSDTTSFVKGCHVLVHAVNLGKGAALKTGFDFAVKNGAEVLIAMDADGQHEAKEIPNFLKALNGKDIVFGYRKFSGEMPFVFRFGNQVLSKTASLLFGIKISDVTSGYRAMTSEAYRQIRWKCADYFVESEMVANAGKFHLRYSEVPINTIYADRYKGTTVLDGIKIILNMFLWRMR